GKHCRKTSRGVKTAPIANIIGKIADEIGSSYLKLIDVGGASIIYKRKEDPIWVIGSATPYPNPGPIPPQPVCNSPVEGARPAPIQRGDARCSMGKECFVILD